MRRPDSEELKLFENRRQELALLERYVREKASDGSRLEILEAGCGRRWVLDLSGVRYRLTGVDLDQDALDFRKHTVNDIDEVIVGDLLSVSLPESQYDVIYNSFVLEHVRGAESLLNNFHRWLRPGGYLILRFPDRDSVFGFVTRLTPFWLHVFYRRYIVGMRDVAKPGFGPYPTVYDSVVSRQGIREYCRKNSLFIIREEYGGMPFRAVRPRISAAVIRLLASGIGMLSVGRLAWRHSRLTYVLQKQHTASSSPPTVPQS